jgi:hypothetical protein
MVTISKCAAWLSMWLEIVGLLTILADSSIAH